MKVSKLGTSNARHTVKVPLPFAEGEEELVVVYRGRSIREAVALDEKYKDVPPDEALPQMLTEEIIEISNVTEEDSDKPVAITPDLFASMDAWALNRIRKAIQDDRLGNPTS